MADPARGPRFCEEGDEGVRFNRFLKPPIYHTGFTPQPVSCCSTCEAWTQCLQRLPIRLDLTGFDFLEWLNSLDFYAIGAQTVPVSLTGDSGDAVAGIAFRGTHLLLPWHVRQAVGADFSLRSIGGGTPQPYPDPFACYGRDYLLANVGLPENLPPGICGSHAGTGYRTVNTPEGLATLVTHLYLDAWAGCVPMDAAEPEGDKGVQIKVYAWIVQEWPLLECPFADRPRQQVCCEILRTDPVPITPELQLADLVDLPLYSRTYEDFIAQRTLFWDWWDNWLLTNTWKTTDLTCAELAAQRALTCSNCADLLHGGCSHGACNDPPNEEEDEEDECPLGPTFCGLARGLPTSAFVEVTACDGTPLGEHDPPLDDPEGVCLLVDPKTLTGVQPIVPLESDPPTAHHGNTASLALFDCDHKMDCGYCPLPPVAERAGEAAIPATIDFRWTPGCTKQFRAIIPDCLDIVSTWWSFGATGATAMHTIENVAAGDPETVEEIVTLVCIDARGCIYQRTKTVTGCGTCPCPGAAISLTVQSVPVDEENCIFSWSFETGPAFGPEECRSGAAWEIQELTGGAPVNECDCETIAAGDFAACDDEPATGAWLGENNTAVFGPYDYSLGDRCFRFRFWDAACGCPGPWTYFPTFASICGPPVREPCPA